MKKLYQIVSFIVAIVWLLIIAFAIYEFIIVNWR